MRIAPLSVSAAFRSHFLYSSSHRKPLVHHVARPDVRQVDKIHRLPYHGAVDSSPRPFRLWFFYNTAAQLVPKVTHIRGGGQFSVPQVGLLSDGCREGVRVGPSRPTGKIPSERRERGVSVRLEIQVMPSATWIADGPRWSKAIDRRYGLPWSKESGEEFSFSSSNLSQRYLYFFSWWETDPVWPAFTLFSPALPSEFSG